MMNIRRATPDDAALLCALAERTFVETFGHLYPPQDLVDYLATAYPVDGQRQQLASGDYAAWLLEVDAQAVGFAFAGPCGLPHADVQPGDGELKRLYVLREHQNGGRGGQLFAEALQWLQARGGQALWIGVWSENLGAQRFYGRQGFVPVGSYEFPVGQVRDKEFILRRTLG
ncbi:MAG: N-acetyltransferase family protein [Stenotrophomonas sp.]